MSFLNQYQIILNKTSKHNSKKKIIWRWEAFIIDTQLIIVPSAPDHLLLLDYYLKVHMFDICDFYMTLSACVSPIRRNYV